jgi:chromosome segregation ATPase
MTTDSIPAQNIPLIPSPGPQSYSAQPPMPPAYVPPAGAPYPPPTPPSQTAPEAKMPEPEPEISSEIIEQIALRVDLETLDSMMGDIKKRMEELSETLSKTEVTSEIETKIKNLKDQAKDTKARREKLMAGKRDLPFEAELAKKQDIQDRLAKINEAYRAKKVTEAAFKKLRTEYEQALAEIDNKSRAFKQKLSSWVKKLKTEKDKFQEQVEMIEARFVAGELTPDQYNAQKEETTEKLSRYNNVLKFLNEKL